MTAGLFVLGAALIAAVGGVVTAAVNAASNKRASKDNAAREAADAEAKAARQAADAKDKTRRQLYDQLISAALTAADYITNARTKLGTGDSGSTNFAVGFRLVLAPVRNAAEGIRADGSDEAKAIATTLLAGISDLWEQSTAKAATYPEDVLTKAHDALTRAHAQIIDTKRKDLG